MIILKILDLLNLKRLYYEIYYAIFIMELNIRFLSCVQSKASKSRVDEVKALCHTGNRSGD